MGSEGGSVFHSVQIGPRVHTVAYAVDIEGSLAGSKTAGGEGVKLIFDVISGKAIYPLPLTSLRRDAYLTTQKKIFTLNKVSFPLMKLIVRFIDDSNKVSVP